jgi:hypothetical protein
MSALMKMAALGMGGATSSSGGGGGVTTTTATDLFSATIYSGNSSTQSISTGLALLGYTGFAPTNAEPSTLQTLIKGAIVVNGNTYIAENDYRTDGGVPSNRVRITKFNSSNVKQWSVLLNNSAVSYDTYPADYAIAVDPSDDSVYVGLHMGTNPNGYSAATVTKLNSSGAIQWSRSLDATYGASYIYRMVFANGAVYLCGSCSNFFSNSYDQAFILKIGTDGSFTAGRTVRGQVNAYNNRLMDMLVSSDGYVYALSSGHDGTTAQPTIVKFNASTLAVVSVFTIPNNSGYFIGNGGGLCEYNNKLVFIDGHNSFCTMNKDGTSPVSYTLNQTGYTHFSSLVMGKYLYTCFSNDNDNNEVYINKVDLSLSTPQTVETYKLVKGIGAYTKLFPISSTTFAWTSWNSSTSGTYQESDLMIISDLSSGLSLKTGVVTSKQGSNRTYSGVGYALGTSVLYDAGALSNTRWAASSVGTTVRTGSSLAYQSVAGNGGMLWIKNRKAGSGEINHTIFDTLNGAGSATFLNSNIARATRAGMVSFDSAGFSLNYSLDTAKPLNVSNNTYVAYSFACAAKFFDMVRYTGNGSTQGVLHALGIEPGMIIFKPDNASYPTYVCHRGLGIYRMDAAGGAGSAAGNSTNANTWNGGRPASYVTAGNYNVGAGGGGAGYWGGDGGYGGIGGGGGGASGYTATQSGGQGGPGAVIINYDTYNTVMFVNVGAGSTFSWTVPTGVTSVKVWAIGAGGGGGGSDATDSSSGGGGGAGGIAYKVFNVTAGQTITGTMGAGGAGGVDANNGNTGGSSSATYNGVTITATGGGGGRFNSVTPATGGTGTGGDFNATGGQGGYANGDMGGGGGGGINGSNGNVSSGGAGAAGAAGNDFQGLSLALASSGKIDGQSLDMQTTAASSFTQITQGVTSTSFLTAVGGSTSINGVNYTAYLFGHDPSGNIACGAYFGNSDTNGKQVDLGWEPQFVMIKRANGVGDWHVWDAARGMPAEGAPTGCHATMWANATTQENTSSQFIAPNVKGFNVWSASLALNNANEKYIYMAIRRTTKVPTTAASVLTVFATGSGQVATPAYDADLAIHFLDRYLTNGDVRWFDRVRGVPPSGGTVAFLASNSGGAETSLTSNQSAGFNTAPSAFLSTDGKLGVTTGNNGGSYDGSVAYFIKRARKFFDIVNYMGNGLLNNYQNHNLGVAPELVITKSRGFSENWLAYFCDGAATYPSFLNDSQGQFSGGSPWTTDTQFLTHNNGGLTSNFSSQRYVAYLFATLAGISKVGKYTGTGADGNLIDCGFSNGARFVMIKRFDAPSDWQVFDAARGIVAAGDPRLVLNRISGEDTFDILDPAPQGFIVNGVSDVNAAGGTYRFLAIA